MNGNLNFISKTSLIVAFASLSFLFACQSKPQEVRIANMLWKTENLATEVYQNGDTIPYIKDAEEWRHTEIGAWTYYEGKDSLGRIFGKLYNWYAVNDSRGICPKGWHVSSKTDWLNLIAATNDPSAPADDLKSKEYWQNPKAPLKNTLKFYSLPGGNRKADGVYNGILLSAPYWTSTDSTENMALAFYMNTLHSRVGSNYGDKNTGLACRCVKD